VLCGIVAKVVNKSGLGCECRLFEGAINESVEARIREINDALQLLRNLVAKDFELTIV